MKPFYFIILCILLAVSAMGAVAPSSRSSMTGRWKGDTHIIVSWCNQSNLPVSLEIHSGGKVTGKVGDAELVSAKLKKKQNWLGQGKGPQTTHIVHGTLKSPILAAEGISRREVFIHVRLDDAHLTGSLATSGSKFGGKKSMVLAATSLRLARSP